MRKIKVSLTQEKQSQDQTNKLLCHKCKRLLSISRFSPNRTKTSGYHDWCKLCVKKNTRRWYKKHKEQAKATSLKWAHDNPEKRKESCRHYFVKHRGDIYEYRRTYRLRMKLDDWIQEIGDQVVFSIVDGDCQSCGMPTKKINLYKLRGMTICVDCTQDFKSTSIIPKRVLIPKHECKTCGRLFPFNGKDKICIDCRVIETRKIYQQSWVLSETNIQRLEDLEPTDEDLA